MCRQDTRHYWLTLIITASLLLTGLLPVAFSQDRRRKPIVVSFGQPNIWSLEQAHYLLARMHMTNLDLQAKALTQAELDPNLTHGARIQILRQLLEVSGQYDQGVGFQNNRIVDQARFNDTRRRELTTNRDRMRSDSLQLEREINQLENERSQITDATSDRAKQLDAAIKQKNADQAAIDKEVTFHDAELQKLGAEPTGTPSSPSPLPSPFDKNRLPSSVLDELTKEELKKLAAPGRDPKLNASTMLDNTVQLQYEIIAKQLTLLRDEVGPGERLVFLELPQSIYSTPGSGDEKMAQAWWHVNGYTRTDPLVRLLLDLYEVERKWYDIQRVPAFRALAPDLTPCPGDEISSSAIPKESDIDPNLKSTFKRFKAEHATARSRVIDKLFREANIGFDRVEQNGARNTNETVEAIRKMLGIRSGAFASDQKEGGITREFVDLKDQPSADAKGVVAAKTREDQARENVETLKWELLSLLSKPGRPNVCEKNKYSFEKGLEFIRVDHEYGRGTAGAVSDIERSLVRTVDIIPRQSSLNVNDIQQTVKATGILAAFKFLFGFAGQVNFQRQREQFEQFVHQELYASGFGKGNRDFGWTFGALPGSNRVAPGVRTTYAALVVPDDAESVILSARGCYFPRKSYQPLDFNDTAHADWDDENRLKRYNCGDQQTFILPIPGGGNTANFWVTGVSYEPVRRGEFVTVSVRGNNFSSQMGVLVNGVPLFPTVGLAHPHLMPKPATAGATPSIPIDCTNVQTICGRYERIDPQQIVFSFKMPTNAEIGIPTITLVAPGKSIDLNSLPNLTVNGERDVKLGQDETRADYMFGTRSSSVLSINELLVMNDNSGFPLVKALLTGTGFDRAKDAVYINGIELDPTSKSFRSANVYELRFSLSSDENLKVTVVQDKQVVTKSFPNPGQLRITNATVIKYDPPVKNKPGLVILKIEGVGFNRRLDLLAEPAGRSRLEYVSPTEVIARIRNPKAPFVVRLRDSITGAVVSRVVESLPAP
jgi:hypothetical protein